MNSDEAISKIDYISLFLVISFFIHHNIYIVFIGILLSIYSIYKIKISDFIKLIKLNDSKNIKEEKTAHKNSDELCNKEYLLELVEKTEESGFIPSIKKDIDTNAA